MYEPIPTNFSDLPSGAQSDLALRLYEQMSQSHAAHGMVARVFARLGGEEFMYEWAQDNPGRFLTLMFKLIPPSPPVQGVSGDVVLHVHNSLSDDDLKD